MHTGVGTRNKMKAEDLLAKGERITKISIFTLISFGFLLLLIGVLSGSVALRGDGIHTLGDAFVSLIVLVGLRLLHKSPSERFQFGYYKMETFASMIVAIFLIFIGIWIFYDSYLSLIHPTELTFPIIALVASAFASASFFLVAMYKRKVADMFGSLALKTDAKNSIKTGAASSIVFLGLAFSYLGYYRVEAVAGMVIAIFIFVISYGAVKESSLTLMDGCACPGTRGNVKSIAESVEGVEDVHEIRLRKSGPYVVGEMHIKVDGNLSVYAANEIVEKIEKLIKKHMPVLRGLTIKVEPIKKIKIK
jgi:cation diffusion facilitator family transporter